MTLVEFLEARIAEDVAIAIETRAYDIEADEEDMAPRAVVVEPVYSRFVDHFTPARVLAECATKRAIIELHQPGHECSQYVTHGGVREIDTCSYCHDFEDCSTLKLLAAPYASHPEFDTNWSVG